MSKWTKKRAAFVVAKSSNKIAEFKNRYDLVEKIGELYSLGAVDATKITPDNQVEFAFTSGDTPDDAVSTIDLVDDRFLDIDCHMVTKMYDKAAYKKECKRLIEAAQSGLGPKKKLAKTEKERIQKSVLVDVMKTAQTTTKTGGFMYDCDTGVVYLTGVPARFVAAMLSKFERVHTIIGTPTKIVANWEYFSAVKDRGDMFRSIYDNANESFVGMSPYAGDISVDMEDDDSSGQLKKAKFSGDAPSVIDHAREIILNGTITNCVVCVGQTYITKLFSEDPKIGGLARTDGKKLSHYDYFKFIDTCRTITE